MAASDVDVERVPLFLESNGSAPSGTASTTKPTSSSEIYRKSVFDHGEASTFEVVSYMLVFFLAMIGHELALEAATTEFAFVESIAYCVTLFQFAFCLLLPLLVSQGHAVSKFPTTFRDTLPFVRLSWVVFGATALASQSLKWVTYPTKVVFKCAKLIPTMIVATIMQGKRYAILDYLAALLICIGAAGYAMDSNVSHGPVNNSVPGLVLLLLSIVCDAIVPNLQQQFMSREDPLTAAELMVNVNAIGLLQLLLYMAATGSLQASISTCRDFPRLVLYLILVGIGSSAGVLAYTRLIRASGSVVAVAVATLRKVATVALSYVVFPKPLLGIHAAAGAAVFIGIGLSVWSKQHR